MDSPDKLRKTQVVLAALFEATPDYVTIADVVNRRFLYLNGAARRMVGLEEEEDTLSKHRRVRGRGTDRLRRSGA